MASSRFVPVLRLMCALSVSVEVVAFTHQGQHALSRTQCESQNESAAMGETTPAIRADGTSGRISSCTVRDRSTPCSNPSAAEVSAYERMRIPARGELSGHAIFGALLGDNLIEEYEVWKRRVEGDENVVLSFVTFGKSLNGHSGVVHGGILSLIFDDVFGFAYHALGVPHAVTANLNVDYRAPLPQELEAREGRKLHWKAQLTSMDHQTLYAEATSLYVIPRSN
jgi:acyl-coenzyme A thioesterase PaaI-like protein